MLLMTVEYLTLCGSLLIYLPEWYPQWLPQPARKRECLFIIFTLNIRTDIPDQTVLTQIRLLLNVCIVALHPKSTAMVMAGRSVHLTKLFPGQA